jgi:hypothetical protein
MALSLVAGLAALAWLTGSDPAQSSAVLPPAQLDDDPPAGPDVTAVAAIAVAAVALALQLFVVHRFRHTAHRAALTATASLAIVVCAALLVTGHQAQRMRSTRHESLDTLLLRDRPAAVSYDPGHATVQIEPRRIPDRAEP